MDKMKREDDAKSRESVMAEREARRLAKQKVQDKSRNLANVSPKKSIQKDEPVGKTKMEEKVSQISTVTNSEKLEKSIGPAECKSEKSREEIMAERELKKQAKLAKKTKTADVLQSSNETKTPTDGITKKLEKVSISEKPVLSKAERREKQEAQRVAKAKLLAEKGEKAQKPVQSTEKKPKAEEKAKEITVRLKFIEFFASTILPCGHFSHHRRKQLL